MRRRFFPLILLLLSISWSVVSAQDCPALVENALSKAQASCAIMRGNQACYGYQSLEAQLQEGLSTFAFNGAGDITPVDTIQSLHMSALDPVKDEWGVTLFRVRADISPDQPNENVTMLAFGAVSIAPDKSEEYQPMQAFAFRTGDAESGCTDITENGLIIQTPEGVGRVTLWINDVRVRIGSTVLFQAQPAGDLIVSTFEGHAEVEALGETREAAAGMQVRVPMDLYLHPSAPPTVPEAFDMASTGLASFMDVTTSFTDGSVVELLSVAGSSGDTTVADDNSAIGDNNAAATANDGSSSGEDHEGGCNGDHGQGNANGNCFGHDNQNGNGGGNGNGNSGGNGNGNGKDKDD
jgi:hypothetical protein